MSSIGDISKKLGRKISDNSPVILTSMAVGGVVSTAYFTATATAKSVHRLYAEGAYDEEVWEEQTFLDRAKIVWPNYIPPVVIGATTIGCVISGHGVHTRRQAALMGLYSVTDAAFSEYRDKVVEVIGEKEEQKVRDDIAQDQVQTHGPSEVIMVGSGDHLCYDSFTARYFQSSVEDIRRAENKINAQIINDGYASQNDFYREIGLSPTAFGDEIGWRVEHMLELNFTSTLTDTGKPALSVNYRAEPIRDYYRNL